MPRKYPVEFRRKVLDRVEAGKPVAEVALLLGVLRKIGNIRDRIDRSQRAGMSAAEAVELAAAQKLVLDLETVLAAAKWANELLKAHSGPSGVGRSLRRP